MTITLDHVVLPAHDNEASARFFAHVLGLSYDGPDRHFAPVRINKTLSVVFLQNDSFTSNHLGFHVGEDDFPGILRRLGDMGVAYGNDPRDPTNMRTDHPFGGRGLFFVDANGHLFEVMTQVNALSPT